MSKLKRRKSRAKYYHSTHTFAPYRFVSMRPGRRPRNVTYYYRQRVWRA